MPEIWDAYKKDGTPAGFHLLRGEPIPEGFFHCVCSTIVRHRDGSYLLMQRDWDKPNYPGCWELGACRSIWQGETPLEGAIRELKEECGLDTCELELLFVVRYRSAFYHHYLCVTDCDKNAITLQSGETIAFRWIERNELLEFFRNGSAIPSQKQRLAPYLDQI